MASEVKVRIKSVIKTGEITDVSREEATGTLSVSGDGRFLLRYSSEGEGGASDVSVKSDRTGRVVVTRTGTARSKMVFDLERRTDFTYDTPMGGIGFTIETKSSMLLIEKGPAIRLVLEYVLCSGGEKVSENRIEIETRG